MGEMRGRIFREFLGEIDRNWTATNSYSGSVRATYHGEVVDHGNHVVVGAGVDHGSSHRDKYFPASRPQNVRRIPAKND
jgi:hypothetical protein